MQQQQQQSNAKTAVTSMIPTKQPRLIPDPPPKKTTHNPSPSTSQDSLSTVDVPDEVDLDLDSLSLDEKKRFCLWSHQIRKLQLVSGKPYEKYAFPATRSQEVGWWLVDAMERSGGEKGKSSQAGSKASGEAPLSTLLDFKLGRVRK